MVIYGVIFALSLLMPPLYFAFVRKKQDEPYLFVLFLCVCVVNLGYFLLSLSKTVQFALWANKIAYLGQVFVPMCMFMIISKLCGFTYKKWLVGVFIGLAVLMYAIVFTTGWLNWYYVSVTLEHGESGAYLVKEYGVLHPTNIIYVVAYFVAMLVVIGLSLKRNKDASQKLAVFMLAIVLGNIGMWVIEKIISWNFELLAISYLMSVFAFFFVYILLQDYILKKDVPPPVIVEQKAPIFVIETEDKADKIQKILTHLPYGKKLSVRQMDVLDGIICGKSRKEIAVDLHLSENTVKMHTSSLFKALEVTSREELYELLQD